MLPSLPHWRIALAAALLCAWSAPTTAFAVDIEPDRRALAPGRNAATGHVRCGSGFGTAQLVGSTSVIVTAAHVLFGRSGPRAGADNCQFEIIVGGERRSAAIDVSRIRAGTMDPYGSHASFDWAVARLAQPIAGPTPYALASGVGSGAAVTLVSGRTLPINRAPMAEACQVRAVRAAEGGREAMLDCSAQSGDSGAAVLDSAGRVAAIYVGFRSVAPQTRRPFSAEHYNFAIAVSGSIRAAVAELSR